MKAILKQLGTASLVCFFIVCLVRKLFALFICLVCGLFAPFICLLCGSFVQIICLACGGRSSFRRVLLGHSLVIRCF
jgi:hypothetical protein